MTVQPDAAPPPTAATSSPAGSSKLMWAILGVVLIADLLDLLDATITNIAAPTIVAHLGGGPALVKWLGAAYALAMGTLLVMGGRLGDKYGQRRLFLVGMAGFTIDANIAGLSWRPVFLINIVLGGAGLIAATRLLPRIDASPANRADPTGSLLLGGAM